jgi:ABC-type multidrug transport system fused ATPase/permease subunit
MKDLKLIVSSFAWVYSKLARQSKCLMIVALVMMMANAVINSIVPSINGRIIDSLLVGQTTAIKMLCMLALILLIGMVVEVGKRYIVEKVATGTQKNLVVESFDHILHVDLKWLKTQQSGGLNGKIQRSVDGSVHLLKIMSMDFLPNLMIMLFAVIVAMVTNPYVGAIILVCALVGIFIIIKQIKSQKGIRLELLSVREKNDSNMVEILSGIEAVRVADDESRQIRIVEEINEELRKKEMNHHKKMILFDNLKSLNIKLWYLVILLIGITLMFSNVITTGEIVTFTLLFNNVANPLQDIHRFLDEAHEASLKTQDLMDIISKPIDKAYSVTTSCNKVFTSGNAVTINDLSFGYDNKPIINNLNCDMKKGDYIGIIGTTGSGKSTLISLMMRIWPIKNEKIYIFDRDINTICKNELSNYVVYMSQTPFIFRGSIRDNLLSGTKHNPSDEDLMWALDKANLLDFVCSLEDGLNHIVEERGCNLSGGQRQRLALARVFLKLKSNANEKIIILDEATSALDKITEKKVIDNLLELKGKDTTIISIAHNLSTLESTDKIIKLEQNAIKSLTYGDISNKYSDVA